MWKEMFGLWARAAALPEIHDKFQLVAIHDEAVTTDPLADHELHPITAFICIIAYQDGDGGNTERLITCRRYDMIGDLGYVGAICHSANGYRQFRCDRIVCVSDARTGETLGDGKYFARFAITSSRERAPTWGLTSTRKAHLVAGLNVLAFMARCDGHWHELEEEVIESFVTSMWIRKEWDGDPPIADIIEHAQRLAPDAAIFRRSVEKYCHSENSMQILRRAVAALIEADGVVCDDEVNWSIILEDCIDEYDPIPPDMTQPLRQ